MERTRRMLIVLALGLTLGALGATRARADSSNAGGGALTAGQLVGILHRLNEMEVAAGKMARRRGRTDAMKDYGRTLEHDHARADESLKQYARQHDLDLDEVPPRAIESDLAHARDELRNLDDLGGAAFDREFAELMVEDHQRAIQLVERARGELADPQLQAMLGELEPDLREHARIAANLLFEDDAAPSSSVPQSRRQWWSGSRSRWKCATRAAGGW